MKLKFTSLIIIAGILNVNSFTQPVIVAQKAIGGSNSDEFHSMYITRDGGMVVAGNSYSNKSGEKTQNIRGFNDYWVVKLDKAGKIEWDRTLGGNGNDNCKAVIQTSDGGYALIGESNSNTSVEKSEDSRGDLDYWLVKLDSLGNIEWDRTIGGSSLELVDNIVQTNDGGYLIAGSSNSFISGEKSEDSRGNLDMWIVKVNKSGKKVWDKTIGGDNYDLASGIILTSDGGAAIAGFSGSGQSGEKSEANRGVQSDYWIVKLDKKGNIEWDKTIGGSLDDYGRGIQQTSDGGYLIAGNSNSNTSFEKSEDSRGGYDYWVVKLDSKGNFQRDETIGGNGDETDVWNLDKTSDGGFIFGGNSVSNASGEKTEDSRGGMDYWVIKLGPFGKIQWDKTLGGFDYEAMYSAKEIAPGYYAIGGASSSDITGDRTQHSRGGLDYWIVLLKDPQLKTVNAAGTKSSQISSAIEKTLNVYPNPAKDKLNIKVDGKTIISLSDQSGRIILTKTVDENDIIDISALPSGLYFLKNILTGEMQKVVVNR